MIFSEYQAILGELTFRNGCRLRDSVLALTRHGGAIEGFASSDGREIKFFE